MEFNENFELQSKPAADPTTNTQRVSLNRMTIYEKAHIIGVRAAQLSDDAPPFVDIGNMTNCIEIATKELAEKKLPFIIKRRMPDNTFEYWPIEELYIPDIDF